jgi:FkbM family methyltransferase
MNLNLYKLYNCLGDRHSSLGEKFLFVYLTRYLAPDLIMDIGSRDGSDALNFKQFNPNAEVFAIEANPDLFEKMSDNQRLSERGVKIFNLAATNTDGMATFSIFNEKKGTGSLRKRANGQLVETFDVKTQRIDSLVKHDHFQKIALWIDVEGNSFEVIEGCENLMSDVLIVQAEVEATKVFEDQVTQQEIRSKMQAHGFVEVEGGVRHGNNSGNIIFLRREIARKPSFFIRLMGKKIYFRIAHKLKSIFN